jgi:hypothetical protein
MYDQNAGSSDAMSYHIADNCMTLHDRACSCCRHGFIFLHLLNIGIYIVPRYWVQPLMLYQKSNRLNDKNNCKNAFQYYYMKYKNIFKINVQMFYIDKIQ